MYLCSIALIPSATVSEVFACLVIRSPNLMNIAPFSAARDYRFGKKSARVGEIRSVAITGSLFYEGQAIRDKK